MATTHGDTTRGLLCETITTQLGASGFLEILDSIGTILVRCALSSPAFDTPGTGSMNALTITDGVVIADGTAASFALTDNNDLVIVAGSVSGLAGSGELKLSSLVLAIDDVVQISAGTYTAPV